MKLFNILRHLLTFFSRIDVICLVKPGSCNHDLRKQLLFKVFMNDFILTYKTNTNNRRFFNAITCVITVLCLTVIYNTGGVLVFGKSDLLYLITSIRNRLKEKRKLDKTQKFFFTIKHRIYST